MKNGKCTADDGMVGVRVSRYTLEKVKLLLNIMGFSAEDAESVVSAALITELCNLRERLGIDPGKLEDSPMSPKRIAFLARRYTAISQFMLDTSDFSAN